MLFEVYARQGVISHACKRVDSGVNSNWVALNVASDSRIAVSEPVVVKARLSVKELAGEPQLVGELETTLELLGFTIVTTRLGVS